MNRESNTIFICQIQIVSLNQFDKQKKLKKKIFYMRLKREPDPFDNKRKTINFPSFKVYLNAVAIF